MPLSEIAEKRAETNDVVDSENAKISEQTATLCTALQFCGMLLLVLVSS